MTKQYELLFALKPTLAEEEVQAKITFLKETLEKNGAQIVALQDMGSRKLAYKIQKFERARYGVLYFTAPPAAILEVERIVKITEDFIKYMTVKYEKQKELKHWNKMVEKFAKKDEVPAEETPIEAAIVEEVVDETVIVESAEATEK